MALGIGHIMKLFEPDRPAPDLAAVAEQLRQEAPHNTAAAKLLEALLSDFPELKGDQEPTQPIEKAAPLRKAA